jgi:hypothetical protein
MATVYPLSTYSLATIAVTVASASGTPTYIWSAAVPAGAKGKAGILQMFFNLYVGTNFFAGQTFNYGIYVDGVALAIGDSTTIQYTQSAATGYAISSGGVLRGTNGFLGYNPLIVPVSFSSGASVIQIGITNSSLAMSSVTSVSPHVLVYQLSAAGTANTSNSIPQNVFTTTGLGNYTVPTTVQGGAVQGVFIYSWGSTGSTYGAQCGSGGFVSGYYPCSAGTNLQYVVGGAIAAQYAVITNGGSGSGGGNGGGAFSGVFLSNAGGIVQSNALIIAGGGGQSGNGSPTNGGSGGGGGAGAYATIASGVGYSGGNGYSYASNSFVANTGGTLTAGGTGTLSNGGALIGGAGGFCGGGGGYYGGGGTASPLLVAGGGSSFAANAVSGPTFLAGSNATTSGQVLYPPGGVTSPYYYSNASFLYGYGGSNLANLPFNGYGLVAIVPAIGASANQIGVQANIFVV